MLAKQDAESVRQIQDRFIQAGDEYALPPALLAAIASRESRCGKLLDANGWGDGGHAFGIMQIDRRYQVILGEHDPSGLTHIAQAAIILKRNLQQLTKTQPDWPPARQLQAAVAAYNSGLKNIKTLAGMDIGTTRNDYSNDVWARAQYFAAEN
jgi:soluble lytic murein transglycosylase-like protein